MKQALIVDDHPVMRGGVKALLEKEFPSLTFKESSGEDGIIEEICGHNWVFVVLDISLPGGNGIDIIKKTHDRCPEIPIIAFSLFPKSQFGARALRAGAVAYLSKDSEAQELIDAVKMALRGGAHRDSSDLSKSQLALSDRELQVLTLFGKGMTRKEISQYLNISGKTVSTYKSRLLQKLGLRTLADLIRYAGQEGLID